MLERIKELMGNNDLNEEFYEFILDGTFDSDLDIETSEYESIFGIMK
jgi:hypothetical protein